MGGEAGRGEAAPRRPARAHPGHAPRQFSRAARPPPLEPTRLRIQPRASPRTPPGGSPWDGASNAQGVSSHPLAPPPNAGVPATRPRLPRIQSPSSLPRCPADPTVTTPAPGVPRELHPERESSRRGRGGSPAPAASVGRQEPNKDSQPNLGRLWCGALSKKAVAVVVAVDLLKS